MKDKTKSKRIIHAGTKKKKDKILSNGGRVLNFVVRSDSFKNNREGNKSYQQINSKMDFREILYKTID